MHMYRRFLMLVILFRHVEISTHSQSRIHIITKINIPKIKNAPQIQLTYGEIATDSNNPPTAIIAGSLAVIILFILLY